LLEVGGDKLDGNNDVGANRSESSSVYRTCENEAQRQTLTALALIGDCDDDVKQAIANKIIELARTGERNPDLVCERALEDIRRPQVGD
jgi:hypothetical protein